MRGYSHLSDDEREQIGLLKVLGHSIGDRVDPGNFTPSPSQNRI